MLEKVDRRSTVGKRDYAVLLLLVNYGLRAREVAALTLDDIDRKRDRIHIRGRKAGHSTIYPLVPTVGEALLAYLQQGRPKTKHRALFLGGHLKTGHRWTLQNRPMERNQNKSIYTSR
jgi:integrase/recombinase XerD